MCAYSDSCISVTTMTIVQVSYMRLQPEQCAMMTIFDWVRLVGLQHIIWHTANERRCSMQYGAMLKRMGVIAGVSDITVARPAGKYHGAFIEVKVGKNKATTSQLAFLEAMNNEGYFTKVCYGVNETINTIQSYLNHQGISESTKGSSA